MPASSQPVSPAELAALEQAFARDAASDSYRSLCEAYLAMGRFMEAMVVCKRGIKTHPEDASARVLLARVYATQGRTAKALEELRGALKLAPADVAARRMTGELQLAEGDRDAGVASLRAAWELARDDEQTLATMKRFAISFTAEVPRVDGRGPGAVPEDRTASSAGATAAPDANGPVPPGAATRPAETPAPRPSEAARAPAAPAPAAAPRAPQVPERESGAAYSERLAERYGTQEFPLQEAPRRRSRARIAATLVLGSALAIALLAWGVTSSVRRARAVEIDHLLREAREQIEKDTYASYQQASALCQRILRRDGDALGGRAYLAYVDAIRWGELGDGEEVHADLDRQLDAVKRLGRGHSHAYAAQAYRRLYAGDARGAIEELQRVLAGPENASALLHGVLGVVEMEAGDLDVAREQLTYAHDHAPGDVRTTQMLAEQWRRRGQGYEAQASALYDAVLTRLEPDHVPSLLGKAQLLLDSGQPAQATKLVERVLHLGKAAAPRQVAMAHALRGSVLHAQGRQAEGDAEERQALALDPSNAEVRDLVGRRKLRSGDVDGAVADFQMAIQRDPPRLGFYVDLASALMRRPGGARGAVTALLQASDRAGNARVTKLLGDAQLTAGDVDGARSAYEKAIGMEKRYPEAHVALASVYRRTKEYPKAIDELRRAVADYGDGASAGAAWVEIAQLEEARGSPAEMVEQAYASARKADPDSCAALYWFGRHRADRRALAQFVKACAKDPSVANAERLLHGSRSRTRRR